jgi:hypothetical protein
MKGEIDFGLKQRGLDIAGGGGILAELFGV